MKYNLDLNEQLLDRDGDSGDNHYKNMQAEVASASDPPMYGLSGLADYPKVITEQHNDPSEGSDAIMAVHQSMGSKTST